MRTGAVFALGLCCLCLTGIEGLLSHGAEPAVVKKPFLEEVSIKCTPGKFYKRGCKQCFCEDSGRPVCASSSNCKLVNKIPTSPNFLRTYSSAELQVLPKLSSQAAECAPGATYRVDCNACICLANKNLMCNDLLCPSHDDVNRLKAKSVTGQPCTDETKNQECIECSCVGTVLKCEGKLNCVANAGRRHLQEPLDLTQNDLKNGGKACTPGMVYKRDCNRCYCQKDGSLRCTLMKCLKNTEVKRLKKLRLQLEKEGL